MSFSSELVYTFVVEAAVMMYGVEGRDRYGRLGLVAIVI